MIAVGGLAVVGRLQEPDLELRDYPVDAVACLDAEGLLGPGHAGRLVEVVGNYLELV